MTKKLIAFALIATVGAFVLPGLANGQTTEELLQQIAQLQAQLQALQQQLAQLQGGGSTGGTSAISGIPAGFQFTGNLKIGMTGDDVRYLQIVLNSDPDTKVADTGAGSPGNETNYFGPLTKAAVIKFQEKYASDCLAPWGLTQGTGFVGSTTRAKLNSILASAQTPPSTPDQYTTQDECEAAGFHWYDDACHAEAQETPAVQPLTVSLAEDTPQGGNIVRGSANTPVTKLVFTGATDSDTTITGLTVTSFGTTQPGSTDISAVKVYDGTRMLASRNLVAGKAYFVFAPGIVVPANGTKTLTIAADINASATIMAGVQLGINDASDITATATFSGTFPVKGSTFLIVPGGQIGTISVTSGPTLYDTSMKVGETDQLLGQFYVSAGSNEDVEVYQVTVKNNGTVADADVANLRLVVDETTVAGPTTFATKKATFDITNPVLIEKGHSKLFKVTGDISSLTSSGSNTVVIYVDTAAVLAHGKTSGVGIGNSGTYTGQTITIGTGALSVSASPNTPKGSDALIIKSTTPQTLGVFSIRAIGEDIMVNKVGINITVTGTGEDEDEVGGAINSVGLYDGDTLLTSLSNVNAAGAPGTDVGFTMNWIIPANTTKDLTVKGITNSLTFTSASATVAVSLQATTWGYSVIGTGMISSGTEGSENIHSSSTTALTALTVYPSGSFATSISDSLTPPNMFVLKSLNGVVLGALKIRADREAQKLYYVKLTPTTTGQLDGVTLYTADGTTALSNTVTESGGVFTITTDDLLSDVNLAKGEWTTLLIKGDVKSTATATDFYFSIASVDDLKTIGVESGQLATAPSTFNFTISSPYEGGKVLGFIPDVLEITKDSESPAGTVGRSNNATVAIWDFSVASTSTNNLDVYRLTVNSKTGLPSGAVAADFKLVDADTGTSIASAAASVDTSTGTVIFGAGTSSLFTVEYGSTKRIALQVDTTSTIKYPSYTHLFFRIPTAILVSSGSPVQTVVLSTATSGTGTITVSNGSAAITGSGTSFTTQLPVGSVIITNGGHERVIVAVADDTHATASSNFSADETGVAFTIKARRGIGYGGTYYSIPAEANEVIFQ